jgi:hypothetical protein
MRQREKKLLSLQNSPPTDDKAVTFASTTAASLAHAMTFVEFDWLRRIPESELIGGAFLSTDSDVLAPNVVAYHSWFQDVTQWVRSISNQSHSLARYAGVFFLNNVYVVDQLHRSRRKYCAA